MKAAKSAPRKTAIRGAPVKSRWPARWPFQAAAASLALAFWAYGPALHGAFQFDDNVLPFTLPGFTAPLSAWVGGVRPILMFTYWVNARLSGSDPFSYHVVNVLFHCATSLLVFLIVRRLLEWSSAPGARGDLLAGFAAAIFLLHPVQAEAVAYLAGRSEALSVLLVFSAFTLFLYGSKPTLSWLSTIAILTLFGAALLAKEHTVVLPVLLLLTDYWWNPGFGFRGIRANWKLYVLISLGVAAGLKFYWGLILYAPTAGFGMRDFTWYQYFFTQCRALFVYIGLFLFPVNLTADWDFPISQTIFDRGAVLGLAALLAVSGVAWRYRRRVPLAAYGWFVYLVLMAPTSSILPIKDPIAERRLYFAIPGLLLVLVDLLARVRLPQKVLVPACAVAALIVAGLTRARAAVWADPVALWEDTARKSPAKTRVRFQLGFAYYAAGRYPEAVREFEETAQIEPPTYNLLIDWGLAYDQLNRPEEALAKLRQAALMEPTAHVYSQIAMIYGERSQWAQALDALALAERIEPGYAVIYANRGVIHIKTNQPALAVDDFRLALALDPTLTDARRQLDIAQAMLRAGQ